MIFTLPDSARAQNRAQLRFENLGILEAKPDRAPAEKRI